LCQELRSGPHPQPLSRCDGRGERTRMSASPSPAAAGEGGGGEGLPEKHCRPDEGRTAARPIFVARRSSFVPGLIDPFRRASEGAAAMQPSDLAATAEHQRLARDDAAWRRWGPYLSDRAWGTVREDYSADGNAWSYFPHDHARSRAYRWNEDGLAGIS